MAVWIILGDSMGPSIPAMVQALPGLALCSLPCW